MSASALALIAATSVLLETALAFYGGAHHVPGQHRFRDRGTPVVTNCASRERHRCSIFDRRPAGRWDEARNGGVHEVTRSRTRNRSRIARFMPLRTTSHSADEDVSVGAENREDLDVMEGASEEREGQEDEDRDVVEISEEELMQEWADRGLDPAAFDPRVLLQLWESEDDEDEVMDKEVIDAVMGPAAEKSQARWLKRRQGFRDMEGGDMDGGGEFDDGDVDAIMAAAAAQHHAKRIAQQAQEGSAQEDLFAAATPALDDTAGGDDVETSPPGRAVGIDLGTTNSAVALIVDGEPTLVPNSRGKMTTPSVVSFKRKKITTESGDTGGALARIYVGEAAVERIATHPQSTYSSVKRVVGRTKKEAKEAGVGLGALNVDQSQSLLRLKCPAIGSGVTIPPEDLSAEILRSLIRDAERFIGGGAKVNRAVVAVPAYFNTAQCAATERAGRLAGLDKVKLMREPEAAALAYGLDKGGDEIILVFDLGGGTFDVSVLEVGGGIAEVIATSGDSKLGGDDFDQAITEWLFEEIGKAGGGDPRSSPVVTRQLIESARTARERLSNSAETDVPLPMSDGHIAYTTLTRVKMESLIKEPLRRIMAPVREAAIMADVSLPGDTGAFMDYTTEDSRGERQGGDGESLRKLRTQQAKARKKSRAQAKSQKRQVSTMAEVAKHMEGNAKLRRFPQGRMVDQVVLVGGATRMPCIQRLVAGITGVKPKRTVDPDKAVALGAAAYAGILEGEVEGQEVMTAWQASVYRMMARDGLMS